MHGFQLWANLPASLKMTAPRYQEVKAPEIPLITDDDGTGVRIVCGSFWGKKGPVDGIAADPIYLDVSVPPGKKKDAAGRDHAPRVRLCVCGLGKFWQRVRPAAGTDRSIGGTAPPSRGGQPLAGALRPGRRSHRAGRPEGIRFLLVSGKPLEEPVAWYGPIVMNTQDQLRQAFDELDRGTFLR